ncbi:MAG: hypothetical protein RLZZ09_2526, partial [Pseudomonadota bacterium]
AILQKERPRLNTLDQPGAARYLPEERAKKARDGNRGRLL